ncbi:MAG: signal peptidase I [Quadrisphaera sp.]
MSEESERSERAERSGGSAATPPAPAGRGDVRPRRRGRRGRRLVAALREVLVVVASALALTLLVKTLLLQAFFIPSESMEATLVEGDRILVSKLTPEVADVQRGDVVVFADPGGWLDDEPAPERGPVGGAAAQALTFVGLLPQGSGHLVKRVIGLPGDTVACCDQLGRTTVNGAPLDEDFLAPGAVPSEFPFSVTVPSGSLWVEGDNRQHSKDSRRHQDAPGGGVVPVDDVVGRAVVIAWPLDRATWLSRHSEAFAGVPQPPATAP